MTSLAHKVLLAAAFVHCGSGASPTRGPTSGDSTSSGCESATGLGCSHVAGAEPGSAWHPDPDGDGVPSVTDHCPNVYDVEQGDADDDGIGDFCDDDFVSLLENGPIVDLRAQHVTPYGGWFGFTSPKTTRYGQDYVIAWSTERGDLRSGKSIRRLDGARKSVFRVFAYAGAPIVQPQIITAMDPKTKYYVVIAPLNDRDRPSSPVSNIVSITTADEPALSLSAQSPRVLATAEQLAALRKRHRDGDRSFAKWAKVMGGSVLDAARSGTEHDFGECLSAALLFHGTGAQKYKQAALSLIEAMRRYWAVNTLENNQLRWADANLGICADLMWQELSTSQRNAIVTAYLDDDEAANVERNVDTDEFASIARTWIIDGLVGCEAEGIAPALSERACTLLERGKRVFYGVQLVKARRNQGFFAQSGGHLPDGIGYGLGTSTYWLMSFIALGNSGGGVDGYAPWIWNNLQAMQIQALTPRKLGLATFGDLDSYDNFDTEANSHPVLDYNGGLIAMHMGLLERAGKTEQAGHARWHLDNLYPVQDFGGTWAMLLFAHDGIAPRNDHQGLATSFYDQGMGMFYDRTDWGKDASYFTFRAGWSGADHAHEDAGAFQLYRNGVWITNEDLGYDGPAASAQGHNVPALDIDFDDGRKRPGQFHLEAEKNAQILGTASTESYAYVSADLLGSYISGRHHSFRYDAVTRQALWLKPTKNNSDDRLFIFDHISSVQGRPRGKRAWQLHINKTPTLDGSRATFHAGSYVDVQLLLPGNVALEFEPPQGRHSQYPGQRYTGRLLADAGSLGDTLDYLAVLRASQSQAQIQSLAVDSQDLVGALSGSDLVLFSRNRNASPPESVSIPYKGNVPLSVWWAGLQPHTNYSIASARNGDTLTLKLSLGGSVRTDEAGVLAVSPAL